MNLRKLFDAQKEIAERQSSPTKTRFAEFFYGHRHGAYILLIVIIALVIRLVAIDHGFPYIYHDDEPAVIRSALGIRFDPNPHHFDWSHLYFYLNYFVYMVFAKLRDLATLAGLKAWVGSIAPIIYNDNLIFYLLSRVFSATLGAFTIIPLYLWVKKLVSRNAGLLASAFLALAPFHVRHSHYALIDVPMLFFLSWSLFFSTFSPILAGLFLGFSASTKYNGILGGLFMALFYLLRGSKPLIQRALDVVKLGIFTVIGFFIGTPYALLDYKTFIRTDGPQGALWQFTNVGKVPFLEQIEKFVSALSTKLPNDLGYGAWLILLAGLAVAGASIVARSKATKQSIILTCLQRIGYKPIDDSTPLRFVIPLAVGVFLALTFYISGLEKNRSHYYMVVYPYFFLLAGWAFSLVIYKFKKPFHKIIPILIVLLPSLIMSVSNIVSLVNKTSSTIYGGDVQENVRITP